MNVVVVGKFYADGFATHIAETLIDLGHKVIQYNPGFKQKSVSNKAAYKFQQVKQQIHQLYSHTAMYNNSRKKHLEAITRDVKVDLVISCHDFLLPEEVLFFKKEKGAVTTLWFPDAMSNFGKAMFLNADYDFLFFKEPFAAYILNKDLNKNAFYLPESCNPKKHYSVNVAEEEMRKYGCDITTAGNMHTARGAILQLLNGYDIKVWGNPAPRWMDTNGWNSMIMNSYVIHEEKAKAFKAAKIVLNNMHPTEYYGINARAFEICACEGFQIINDRPALHQLYKAGEELVVYKTIEELKSKIEYYLLHENERKEIAVSGFNRTQQDHTYSNRLDLLFKTIEGKAAGYKYSINTCDFSYT